MKTEQEIREALGAFLSAANRSTDTGQKIMGFAAASCLRWVLEEDDRPEVRRTNEMLEKYRQQKQAEQESTDLQRMWQEKLAGRG